MNKEDFISRVTEMATAVGGTEAVAFVLLSGSELRLLTHIRPDDADNAARQRAVEAFRQIVFQCVAAGKDGVVQVSNDPGRGGAQFCLVSLIRQSQGILGAVAIIVRCPTPQAAYLRLQTARSIADGSAGPKRPRL